MLCNGTGRIYFGGEINRICRAMFGTAPFSLWQVDGTHSMRIERVFQPTEGVGV